MDNVLPSTIVVKGSAFSRWLDLFRVILTIGVVCNHAAMIEAGTDYPFYLAVMRVICGVTEFCFVQLFFVLSGYLFFLNIPEKPSVIYFATKLKKRVFSLLIPYLIANILFWICYWVAGKFAPSLISGFFGDKLRDPLFVFWTGPVNLSLWFIRELIICCLLSPIIWLLIHYTRFVGVLALGVLFAFHIGPAPVFFFTLGAWPAIRHFRSEAVESWTERHPVNIMPSSRAWCFFIYLYHYLLLIGIKKTLVYLLHPASSIGFLACYVASVLLVLLSLTLIYRLLRHFLPKITSVLIGGK